MSPEGYVLTPQKRKKVEAGIRTAEHTDGTEPFVRSNYFDLGAQYICLCAQRMFF